MIKDTSKKDIKYYTVPQVATKSIMIGSKFIY